MGTLGASVTVDDRDSLIEYSSGWGLKDDDGAFDDTLHFAMGQGLTATFTFTGAQVGVKGCGGNTNVYGWPSESFSIDGKNYLNRSDPTATPDTLFYNVDFFTSPMLTPGVHTLVVTNINGTAPNTLWIDSFWYIPVEIVGGTSTQSTNSGAAASSTTSLGSTSSNSSPVLTPVSTAIAEASASANGTVGSGGAADGHLQNTAAIIGGAVGGAVGVVLLAALGSYCFMKRRRSSRLQQDPRADVATGSTLPSPNPRGHVPRLSMREAPASTLSSAPLLEAREGYTFSSPGSVFASAPSLTPGPTSRHEYNLPPGFLHTPESVLSALPGTPSLSSDVQSTSFASGYHDAASTTRDRPLLTHKVDSGLPPPYAAATQ